MTDGLFSCPIRGGSLGDNSYRWTSVIPQIGTEDVSGKFVNIGIFPSTSSLSVAIAQTILGISQAVSTGIILTTAVAQDIPTLQSVVVSGIGLVTSVSQLIQPFLQSVVVSLVVYILAPLIRQLQVWADVRVLLAFLQSRIYQESPDSRNVNTKESRSYSPGEDVRNLNN